MSLPTTAAAGKPYSAREKACDCLIGILFMTVLASVICITPAITRLLILIQPQLPDFNIDSSSLTIRNLDNDTIKADWNVNLIINNLDRSGFYYDQIRASSHLRSTNSPVIIGSNSTIQPLEQKGREKRRLNLVFGNITIQSVNNCSNASSCGLRMEVRAMAEYRGWTWPVKRDSVKVVCKDVKVENRSVEFGRSSCDVSGRWKRLVTEWTSLFWDYLYVLVIFLGILVLSF